MRCMPVATTVTRMPGRVAASRISGLSLPKSARVPVRKQTCLIFGPLGSLLDICPTELVIGRERHPGATCDDAVEVGREDLAGSGPLDPQVLLGERLSGRDVAERHHR